MQIRRFACGRTAPSALRVPAYSNVEKVFQH
jgi:hypothetical protein